MVKGSWNWAITLDDLMDVAMAKGIASEVPKLHDEVTAVYGDDSLLTSSTEIVPLFVDRTLKKVLGWIAVRIERQGEFREQDLVDLSNLLDGIVGNEVPFFTGEWAEAYQDGRDIRDHSFLGMCHDVERGSFSDDEAETTEFLLCMLNTPNWRGSPVRSENDD